VHGADLSPAAQQWTSVVLIWLGLGILTGLLAKVLLPGREPAGAVGTLVIGMLGSVVGPLALSGIYGGRDFNPIGPLGILAAVGSAVVLLLGYRVLIASFMAAKDREE
jgi:uncharacterized membrane protein YeaQ/YmgE (transglycosylase-associated protein family)